MKRSYIAAIIVTAVAILTVGCTTPYTITVPLEEPLASPATVRVGNFTDQLPIDTPDDKKPTVDDIMRFREAIEKQLEKSDLFDLADSSEAYEVRGSIIEYRRGSGFMRFTFGFGAGSARVMTHLELLNTKTGLVIYGGDFSGAVSSWAESGAAMYDRVAKDFVKQLKKQSEQR